MVTNREEGSSAVWEITDDTDCSAILSIEAENIDSTSSENYDDSSEIVQDAYIIWYMYALKAGNCRFIAWKEGVDALDLAIRIGN